MDDAKTIKDVYDHWNIPYQRGKDGEYVEENHLVVTDTGYINYLDDESIFYDNSYPMEKLFCFGDIIIEFSRIFRIMGLRKSSKNTFRRTLYARCICKSNILGKPYWNYSIMLFRIRKLLFTSIRCYLCQKK